MSGGNYRKKLLVKVFVGPIWEERLVKFVDVFTKRRDEFKLALTIHVTVAVDAAGVKLDTVCELTTDLSEKYAVPLHILGAKC